MPWKLRRRLPATAACALLSACATNPVPTSEAVPVPARRILDPQILAPSPGAGNLVIKRDSGWMGTACTVRLYVGGIPAADLRTSEMIELLLPPGEYHLAAAPRGICRGEMAEARIVIAREHPKTYRIAAGMNGEFRIRPTDS